MKRHKVYIESVTVILDTCVKLTLQLPDGRKVVFVKNFTVPEHAEQLANDIRCNLG